MTDTPDMARVEAMFAAQKFDNQQRKRHLIKNVLVGLLVLAAVIGGFFLLDHIINTFRENGAEQDAAYVEEIAAVEARFNTEYDKRIQLEVYQFSSGGKGGSYARTIVAIDGTIRPDCHLRRTTETEPWTLECNNAPQPTRTP